MQPRGVRGPVGIGRLEAEEPQDAQIIFGDPPCRVADETDAAGLKIGAAVHIVVHDAVRGDRQRIHCEVATLGIDLPVPPERDLGLAAESLDVLAQRRHLKRCSVDHQRDRAVVDAGRHRPQSARSGAAHHLIRKRGRSDVDVAYWQPHQRIARCPSHHPRLFAAAVEERKRTRERRCMEPAGVREPHSRAHLCVPGTNRPFSICAGT